MRTISLAVMAALLAAGATSAAARSPAEPKRDCFWSQNITNVAAADDEVVNVRVGIKDVYQFEMFGPCRDVDFNTEIAIVPRGGASNICTGMDAEIISHSAMGPQRCQIRKIHKLTPAEVAALPKRARP